MSGFFEELQRRKVYRVAAAYTIAAGFIIQIASVVFPTWELPGWTFAFRHCAFANWFSHRPYSSLGLRRYPAGN